MNHDIVEGMDGLDDDVALYHKYMCLSNHVEFDFFLMRKRETKERYSLGKARKNGVLLNEIKQKEFFGEWVFNLNRNHKKQKDILDNSSKKIYKIHICRKEIMDEFDE